MRALARWLTGALFLLALSACARGEGQRSAPVAVVPAKAAVLANLRGRSVGTAYAALGHPDSAAPLSEGRYVIAWNRSAPAFNVGGRPGKRDCTLLGTVTRHGIVSDFAIAGDEDVCAASFGWPP